MSDLLVSLRNKREKIACRQVEYRTLKAGPKIGRRRASSPWLYNDRPTRSDDLALPRTNSLRDTAVRSASFSRWFAQSAVPSALSPLVSALPTAASCQRRHCAASRGLPFPVRLASEALLTAEWPHPHRLRKHKGGILCNLRCKDPKECPKRDHLISRCAPTLGAGVVAVYVRLVLLPPDGSFVIAGRL